MARRSEVHGFVLSRNAAVRRQVGDLLKHTGCTVRQVHSHAEAIMFINHARVHVFVADIDEPSSDGLAILLWCKHRYPDIKAFAICHDNSNHSQYVAREFGVDGFFYVTPHSHQIDINRGIARQLCYASDTVDLLPC
ncbi:MAG: response regulator [Mariprofundaceae bacterium]|nr:response regulator [Mariprofundaceae bacterium]